MNAREAKLGEVTRILGLLREDAKDGNLEEKERLTLLQELKVCGRDAWNSDPIFAKDGIETLSKQGLDSTSLEASREALRCLANALLLDPRTRETFNKLNYAGKVAERLKSEHSEDEFIICRLLFLTTYGEARNFDDLFKNHQLGESINCHISRHLKQFSEGGDKFQLPTSEELALSELLKLIFNIGVFEPHRRESFSPSIPAILKILSLIEIPNPPLQGLVTNLINSLLNLDFDEKNFNLSCENPPIPEFTQKINADRLITVLDKAVTAYTPAQLSHNGVPLVSLLRKLHEIAPEDLKKHIQSLLLPAEENRDLPVGQDDTLPSRLLRLSLAPDAPILREHISSFMFELSGKDASELVKNVGYGYAAGFLMSHGVTIPENVKEMDSRADVRGAINPITGQRLDAEPEDTLPEMTEEEKEREAERLFVLFERLRATGVMQVANPVTTARDEGRFEELDDVD